VPRQNPISEREADICGRLRQARQATNLSQVAFARLLGIDSSRLASYEHARVPIRLDLALKAAALGEVSLRWLAEGLEPRQLPIFPDSKLIERAGNGLFSAAYDVWLRSFFDAELKNLKAIGGKWGQAGARRSGDVGQGTAIGILGPDEVLKLTDFLVRNLVYSCPPQLYPEIYADVSAAINQFHRRHLEAIGKFPKNKLPKFTPAESSENRNQKLPTLAQLLDRVRALVVAKGMKAKLAADLDVPPSRLSEWLAGKYEPSGEITLRLLHWVKSHTH
jgi:transcriptional regulator with XRE-family HTH domain